MTRPLLSDVFGPPCQVVAGCGHAQALNVPERIALIADFLTGLR